MLNVQLDMADRDRAPSALSADDLLYLATRKLRTKRTPRSAAQQRKIDQLHARALAAALPLPPRTTELQRARATVDRIANSSASRPKTDIAYAAARLAQLGYRRA